MSIRLTQKVLKELIAYDPDKGGFVWNVRPVNYFSNEQQQTWWNNRFAGKPAGSTNKRGYHTIRILYKLIYAHRLAFLYMQGELPEEGVDHIDHDPSNNRWHNLREASAQVNATNQTLSSTNTSGFVGVWQENKCECCKRGGKWKARIQVKGRVISLGTHDSKKQAIAARAAANIKYKFHNNHGMKK